MIDYTTKTYAELRNLADAGDKAALWEIKYRLWECER